MSITITGSNLHCGDVHNVAYHNHQIELCNEARKKVIACREIVDTVTAKGDIIYGLTTGFGSLSKITIKPDEAGQLSRNIALSHAISVGKPMPREHVRAAMLVRINALVKGISGCKIESIDLMIDMLNKDIIPVVPMYGSLACSGDLCLLSTMLVAMSKGISESDTADVHVDYAGKVMYAAEAFKLTGLEKVLLGSKEGLAITNGSTFTVALLALCLHRINRLYHNHVGAYAMMMEAFRGCTGCLNPKIHEARNHKGQCDVAYVASQMLEGSEFVNSTSRLQDSYSLRCAPQMHGMMDPFIEYSKKIITNELNAATDNPLVFGQTEVVSGGNFAGYDLAFIADCLKIMVTNNAKMSERRQFKVLDPTISGGLPDMLSTGAGLSSGFMITQYTSACLLQRLQHHCFPDSAMNIPTCANQEDVNSNGHNATLNLWEMLDHAEEILGFEYLLATYGIWHLKQRPEYKDKNLGKWTTIAYHVMEGQIEGTHDDHLIKPEFDRILGTITSDNFNSLFDELF